MGKKDESGKEAALARSDEQARQAKVRTGTEHINQIFADSFPATTFDDRAKSYTDFALPQADAQYDDALKNLTFSLARSGNLDSSTRAEQTGQLERQNETARRQIGNTALDQAGKAETDIEAARADLIKTLNSTGDVEGVTNSALTRAKLLTQEPAYSPLGQLFSTGTAAVADQAAQERAAAASGGAYVPRYNTGVFAGGNSVKVTR